MLPFLPQLVSRPTLAGRLSRRRRPDELPQRRASRQGADAVCRRGRRAVGQSMVCWDDLRWIRDAWPGPSSSRASTRPTTRAGRSTRAPTRSWCRTTAAGSSTASRRRCASCPRWWRRSRAHRGAAGRRHSPRQRRRQGAGHGRARRAGRPRLRVRPGRRRRTGGHRAIEILRSDIIRTLKLLGCASVAALDRSYVGVPPEWETAARLIESKSRPGC